MGNWDNGVEQGDGHGVKKFLRDRRGVAEWDGLNFKTNKFLNGLCGKGFWRSFWWRVFGVVWNGARCGVERKNDGNHFGLGALGVLELGIKKTNWGGGQRAE